MIATLLLAAMVFASPVYAQAPNRITLVEASPAPDAVLLAPPEEIRLTFDRLLLLDRTWIALTDAAGEVVELRDPVIRARQSA